MRTNFLFLGAILVLLPFTKSYAGDGGDLFKANCGVCHTVGKGKLVGPDLRGVETRHSEAWILKWVKSSQSLVQSGDKEAVKLFADNNNIPMPDQPLNEDQIKSVLAYIKTGGEPVMATVGPVNTGPDAITVATQKAAQEKRDGGSLLTLFSFSEYLMIFLMGILLIVIYILSLAVKTLTEKVKAKE